jgi:putative ABC transport system permease protein
MQYIPITYADVAIAAVLVLLNGALSFGLQLGLERQILVAALRTLVQLTLVGLVLKTLFALASPWLTLLAVAVMILAATTEVASRQEQHFRSWWNFGLGAGAITMATVLAALFTLTTHIRPSPWYDPRYSIPLVGIVLGNVMNAVSLGLNGMLTAAVRERAAVEAQLALGASRFVALKPFIRRSLRAGLIPIVNQMSAAGLITLPGMMTGQILAGMDPTDAVKYQILTLFLLAGGAGIGVLGAVYASAWRLTDERHRLRLDRLRPVAAGGHGRHRRG